MSIAHYARRSASPIPEGLERWPAHLQGGRSAASSWKSSSPKGPERTLGLINAPDDDGAAEVPLPAPSKAARRRALQPHGSGDVLRRRMSPRARRMDDRQLFRYSRHINLPAIDLEGQQRAARRHVLLIGAGGLGSPAALYLAAAGVGRLTICDGDAVDLTNLQRQIVHREVNIGLNKAISPPARSPSSTPIAVSTPVERRAAGSGARRARRRAPTSSWTASDNFATRHAVNRVCVDQGAAARQRRGHPLGRDSSRCSTTGTRRSPCYHCLFPTRARPTPNDARPWGCSRP